MELAWLVAFQLFIVQSHSNQDHQNCSTASCQHFKFVIDQDVVHDHALEGHVFKRFTVQMATQCHVMCRDDCRCVSMNYIHSSQHHNCELNEANKNMQPAALKHKPGTQYYDLLREYTVAGGRPFLLGQDRCFNRCCQPNLCHQGGTCEEICDPSTVRFNCTCPASYTGQRCEKIKDPRDCLDLFHNGVRKSESYNVTDQQGNRFQVYCDFDSEVDFIWTLIQSFSLGNNDQFSRKRFGIDFAVNENKVTWEAYRLSLSHMTSIADKSSHFRATCNSPDDGLVYTDYARANLTGHDLFGIWTRQCRTFEYLNIRGINCSDCTAGTWQPSSEMWHINSHRSKSLVGCEFDGSDGAVTFEHNFGYYEITSPHFRCTSNLSSTTQHWFGLKIS